MSAPIADKDRVSLLVNGAKWEGWQSVKIQRGVELVPANFELKVTERYPGVSSAIVFEPFQTGQLLIGSDTVVTGYVDRYEAEGSKDSHTVMIPGRSKSEDLVDCSAILPKMAISGVSVLALASRLSTPYGIGVKQLSGPSPSIPQFNVTLGEKPFEIIERIARYAGLLFYDDVDGNMILAQVGTVSAGSGITLGVNVERWRICYSGDQRFQTYVAAIMSTAYAIDGGGAGGLIAKVTDSGVPRFRQLVIVSEQMMLGNSFATVRAQWERARRYGRSQRLQVTVDSWRDAAGTLWTPNTLCTINIPPARLVNAQWVIGEVTYRLDENGTHCDMVLMPKEAYAPEPELLQPFAWTVAQQVNPGAPPPGAPS